MFKNRNGTVYRPLPGKRDIRLLTIHPGQWRDEIKCTLSHYSLDEPSRPAYSALSYVWGSPKVTDLILLNGESWHVTVNLSHALYHIRDTHEPVRIWIDALCINQGDIAERGNQVQLMKDIYAKSQQVVVYLGDGHSHRPKSGIPKEPDVPRVRFYGDDLDEPHLEAFYESVKRRDPLSSFHIFCFLRILGDVENIRELGNNLSHVNEAQLHGLMEGLRLMLLSPWWQRIWVVQELTVPRWVVMRYGHLETPWEMFVAAASSPAIREAATAAAAGGSTGHSKGPLCIEEHGLPTDHLKVLEHFARYVQNSEHLRRHWRTTGPRMDVPARGPDLLTLLQDFSARQASDERDKVFALLALAGEDQRALIRPTYAHDVAHVYRRTCIAMLRHKGSLEPWTGDLARKLTSQTMALESWVPDWSAIFEESDRRRARFYYPDQYQGDQSTPYNACGQWKFTVVGSREEYWDFMKTNVRLLLEAVKASDGNLKPPKKLAWALRYFIQRVSHHIAAHESAVTRLTHLLETYKDFQAEYPTTPSKAMEEFYDRHRGLLDLPMETGVTKQVLHYCHERLWPNETLCGGAESGCLGHSWDEERARLVGTGSKHGDAAKLRWLVEKAAAQYEAYKSLAEQYLASRGRDSMQWAIATCEELLQYCTADNDTATPRIWAKRLFSRSAMVYGEMDRSRPVLAFHYPAEDSEDKKGAASDDGVPDTPFWMDSGFPVGCHHPKERRASEFLVNDFASDARHWKSKKLRGAGPPKWIAPVSEFAAVGMPPTVLSVESVPIGKVERLLGPKLITWADPLLAYETLRAWAQAWQASKTRVGRGTAAHALPLARTLVGDAVLMPDAGQPDARRVGGRIRRLGIEDQSGLMAWFNGPLRERMGLPRKSRREQEGAREPEEKEEDDAQGEEESDEVGLSPKMIRAFDNALVLATEGRVLFELTDGTLGLGPGSMMPDDEVCVLPGGSLWFVIRKLGAAEGDGFALIGDCYLDLVDEEVVEPWPGGLPEEVWSVMQSGSKEEGRGVKSSGPYTRERIWLF